MYTFRLAVTYLRYRYGRYSVVIYTVTGECGQEPRI